MAVLLAHVTAKKVAVKGADEMDAVKDSFDSKGENTANSEWTLERQKCVCAYTTRTVWVPQATKLGHHFETNEADNSRKLDSSVGQLSWACDHKLVWKQRIERLWAQKWRIDIKESIFNWKTIDFQVANQKFHKSMSDREMTFNQLKLKATHTHNVDHQELDGLFGGKT